MFSLLIVGSSALGQAAVASWGNPGYKGCDVNPPTYGSLGDCPAYMDHGKFCTPSCHPGYEPAMDYQDGKYRCDDGKLTGVTCVPTPMMKACEISPPAYGVLGDCPAWLPSGKYCVPKCYDGYEVEGSFYCVNGKRTSEAKCVPNACKISPPAYGVLGDCPEWLASGQYCVPKCNNGYEVEGKFSCVNGKLTSEAKCVPNACKISPPAYGSLGDCPAWLASGQYCVPKCNDGYEVEGKFSCVSGKLTSEAKCVPSACKISPPAYGVLGDCPEWLASGKYCVPKCYDGYEVQGKFSCVNGKLTSEATCVPNACKISPPAYGVLGDCPAWLASGQYCVPKCNDGYEVEGSFYCGNGKLTSEAKCVPNACKISPPAYGVLGVCPAWLASGQYCVPKCNDGYEVEGSFYCVNGKLTSEAKCVPSACKISPPAYGVLGDCPAWLASGKYCVPKCNDGYEVQGKFSCVNGKLTSEAKCVPNACKISPPAYGVLGDCPAWLASGQYCVPKCNDGYEVEGKFSCVNGKLTSEAKCVPSACKISPPAYGVLGDCPAWLVSGKYCVPKCYDGYEVQGKFSCVNGKLTSEATCVPNACKISPPAYGVLGDCPAWLASGQYCVPKCYDGYEVEGSFYCVNGKLTSEAKCVPNACKISPPAYGVLGDCPAWLASGQYCVPKCNYGYEVEGSFYCVNGKLTSEAKCVPNACKISPPAYGVLGDCPAWLASGQYCVPKCNYGYEVEGSFYCVNGKLTSEAKCVPSACKVSPPAYGVLGDCPEWLAHGRYCIPTCNYSYEVQGQFYCEHGKITTEATCLPKNMAPVAKATGPPTGYPNEKLTFSGKDSYDKDGYVATWYWDFGDGEYGSGEIVYHAYNKVGDCTVKLVVTDNRGATGVTTLYVKIVAKPVEEPIWGGR
eukprot:g21308.t1